MTIEDQLREELQALRVGRDDARATAVAHAAVHRPAHWAVPAAAAATVLAAAGVATAVTSGVHGPAPAVTVPSVTPASDVRSPAPDRSTAPSAVTVRCTAPDGHVSYSTVSAATPRWRVRGRWALVYLPRADGTVCTPTGIK